jgi:predicted phage terminase large subunit-like protein
MFDLANGSGSLAGFAHDRDGGLDSFSDWAVHALGASEQVPASHHRVLISELEAISRGETDRLMVLMPPGSAKSTYASILFPAWWFVHHPRSSIIAASHTAGLAERFSRQVRTLITEHGRLLEYRLAPDNRAASRWQTTHRGEYFATGVRGPITGRRADLVIIDDPIKSHADVDNTRARDHLWNWYRADLTTRLKPRGRIVLAMTRWHEDDLAGRLLAHNPAEWRVLRIPALAESGDLLGRETGDPIWPEWEDRSALLRKRTAVGERVWLALFQQSPRPMQGGLFRVDRIEIIDPLPAEAVLRCVRAWDLAATPDNGSNDPDWTVGLKLGVQGDGRWVVLDIVRFRGSPGAVQDALATAAKADGHAVPIGLPEDPGQAGRSQVGHLVRRLAGYRATASRETGSKLTRATPVAAQVEAGNLLLARADWNGALLEELREFPYGRKDDQVDALSRAFTMLAESAAPVRQMTIPLLGR